jgi:hypothetical protein
MCLDIYIACDKPLPEVKWNPENPNFYTVEEDSAAILSFLNPILKTAHVYKVGSFMGCSCGLMYGDGLKKHTLRKQNTENFINYLQQWSSKYKLQLFCTEWTYFPDSYEKKDYSPILPKEVFELEEDVILTVV